MKYINKKKQSCFALFLSIAILFTSFLTNVQIVRADTTVPTLVSAVTDHIGKEIILTFDRSMKDPTGTEGQFTVTAKTQTVLINGTNNYFNIGPAAVTVTSAALGSNSDSDHFNSKQIILKTEKTIVGPITISYTKGSLEAEDGIKAESFTDMLVTDNNISSGIMTGFDLDATEITANDTFDPAIPILKFKYDKPINYDNVQLAWYLFNGYFRNMENDIKTCINFYEKDTNTKVPLSNAVTQPYITAPYTPEISRGYMEMTDWYFWQIQHYAPIGLNLVSQALKPSTTYVVEILKEFATHQGKIGITYSFEFTTTKDSSTKPYWETGSSVKASNVTENDMTLTWSAAKDNHGTAYNNLHYKIYKDGSLLTTVDGNTTTYNVAGLSQGTEYSFKVEAVDFANNKSITNLTAVQTTAGTPPAPNVTNNDAANTVTGMKTGLEYNLDGSGYVPYNAAIFSALNFSGNHTLLVRVAATKANPAGFNTTLTFTTNPPAPAAPSVTADDAANKIVGINSTMEYSIDGGAWIKYTSDPQLTGNHTVKVRISADAVTGTPVGAAKTLNFTNIQSVTAASTPNKYNVAVAVNEIQKDGVNIISPIIPSTATSVSTLINVSSIRNGAGTEKVQATIGGYDITLSLPFGAVDLSQISDTVNDSPAQFVLSQTVSSDSAAAGMLANAPSIYKTIGKVFSFNLDVAGTPVHTFANGKSAAISIKLTADDIKGLDTTKLSAFYYDVTSGKWIQVGGSYDPETMVFTFNTTHFTSFTIMQTSAISSTIPQTGSPLDFLTLMLIGISLLGAGIIITMKKCRRNIQ